MNDLLRMLKKGAMMVISLFIMLLSWINKLQLLKLLSVKSGARLSFLTWTFSSRFGGWAWFRSLRKESLKLHTENSCIYTSWGEDEARSLYKGMAWLSVAPCQNCHLLKALDVWFEDSMNCRVVHCRLSVSMQSTP